MTIFTIGGLVSLAVIVAAYLMGVATEQGAWVRKADEPHRTAMHARGQFFYVVPEAEYCELSRLRTLRDQGVLGVVDDEGGGELYDCQELPCDW